MFLLYINHSEVSWYIKQCPLLGRSPLLGVSANGELTVVVMRKRTSELLITEVGVGDGGLVCRTDHSLYCDNTVAVLTFPSALCLLSHYLVSYGLSILHKAKVGFSKFMPIPGQCYQEASN